MTPALEAMHRLGAKFCWFNAEMDHAMDVPVRCKPMPVWLVEGERYNANFGPVFFTKHLWLPHLPSPVWPDSIPGTLTWRHPGTWVHLGLNYGCIETDRGFWVWPTEKRLASIPSRLRTPSP